MNTKPFSIHALCARLAGAAVLACALPAAALADEVLLAPSPALRCLALPPGVAERPEYPEISLSRKEGGSVKVQLEFRAPDKAPRVTLLTHSHFAQLDRAVEAHVEQYRVPCMQMAEGPVTLLQEYDFDPDGRTRVVASATRDRADPGRAAQLRCMTHIVPDSIPAYPKSSLRRGEEGTLLVRMRFTAPDQPPTLEWMVKPSNAEMRVSIERYVEGLRMPCLHNGPVEAMRAYKFVMAGGAKIVLRDTTLVDLLRAAKDLKTPAYFDFDAMSCPFDLRLTYERPFSKNSVQQLDTRVAAREPLLRWLADLTLPFDEEKALRVFGNSMIVSVPCGKLDL